MVALVVYATKHGATRGIAERVAAALRRHGVDVIVQAAGVSVDASAVDAVVVGSAVYGRAWLPGARDFLRRNLDALGGRPVWVFNVGGIRASWGQRAAATYVNAIPGVRGRLHPRDCRYFRGEMYRERVSWRGALAWRLLGGGWGDFRDWRAIDAWADSIAAALTPSDVAASP